MIEDGRGKETNPRKKRIACSQLSARGEHASAQIAELRECGFHLRNLGPRLPERMRKVNLPPYWLYITPSEQLGDIDKDEIANASFHHRCTLQSIPSYPQTLRGRADQRVATRWTRLAARLSKRPE